MAQIWKLHCVNLERPARNLEQSVDETSDLYANLGMAALDQYTVALNYGGDVEFGDDCIILHGLGTWPKCRSCGEKAELFWAGALADDPDHHDLPLCKNCTTSICGGLLIDLVLEDDISEDVLIESLRKRIRDVQAAREATRRASRQH